ncbi:MAG: peptidoglycan endopeptidase [Chlamydiota bacterium]
MKKHVRVTEPTPILNVSDFPSVFGGKDGMSLKRCEKGHIREVEFVALLGDVFCVEKKISEYIYAVQVPSYPCSGSLYIDVRSTEETNFLSKRAQPVYTLDSLQHQLAALEGTPYVWGGNWSQGIPQWLSYYPPKKTLPTDLKDLWQLKGVDCSGLLYEVTSGDVPRNTSELLSFGRGVPIENNSPKNLQTLLRPLDIMVWKGHVLIVLDEEAVIESKEGLGVIRTSLLKKLEELCEARTPKNEWNKNLNRYFVVRRWLEKK